MRKWLLPILVAALLSVPADATYNPLPLPFPISLPTTTITQTFVSVTSTSSQLIASNSSRKLLKWMVVGANAVTITPGASAAVFGQGMIYGSGGPNSQGGSETFDAVVATNAFQVIAAPGLTSTVTVWEGN